MSFKLSMFLSGLLKTLNKQSRKCFTILMLASLLLPALTQAEVLRVQVDSREPVLKSKEYGKYGAYELVRGRIYFGYDPANPMNVRIVDINLAPRNSDGLVESWANFVALKPVDNQKARGVALVEVSNRGGKFSMRYFNRAPSRSLEADNPEDFGNELLMRQGVTECVGN